MGKHTVKRYFWANGELLALEHICDSLNEAIKFADETFSHRFKIYNEFGELVRAEQRDNIDDSYA